MKTAPDPKDILEFQFKLLSNRQIFDGYDAIPATCNLVAVDGKRGLILTGCNNKITVIRSGDILDKDWRREHILPDRISRLAVNCDCSFVAVTFVHPIAYIYDAASIVQQELNLLREVQLSSAENVHVLDLKWNPCIPGMLCTVTSDHMVGSFSLSNDKNTTLLTVVEKISGLEFLCLAWSPKGKQLVAGCKNGSLIQLKQDLKTARSIAGPNPSVGSVISLLWISNYQFCAAYLDPRDLRINILIVDAPKGEVNATFTSYEDITFGQSGVYGEEAGPRYYFEHIVEWGTIIAASSGSIEVAVLGSRDNGATWESWQLVDSGRAQLPLLRTSESYPVGLAVDRTSVLKLPWGGENLTLPHPVPILHILGTSGQLCSFHVVNLRPEALPICSAPSETVSSAIQPKMNFAPTDLSFNSMSVTSSTPQPKQVNPVTTEHPKPTVAMKLFAEIPNVPTVQQLAVESNVLKAATAEADVTLKPETKIVLGQETKPKEKVSINSNICHQALQEECSLFEKELRNRRGVQVVDIGSATERTQLIGDTDITNRFLIELRETTASLTSDITYLKALLLQTFAWLEETKSKCSMDPSINTCTRTESNKVDYFKSRLFYLQSQLTEAQRALDLQWSEHMNKEKNKMKIPRLEFIYQNMLRHSQIVSKEQERIQSLVKKWKTLGRGDVDSLNSAMSKMNVTSIESGIAAIGQRCRTIASRHCSFSQEKQAKLRNLLKKSTTRIIEVANPSPIQDRLNATISSLTSLNSLKAPREQKIEVTPLPKPRRQETVATAITSSQLVKHPLASLDQIVASIGWTNEQANNNAQNQYLSTKPITAPLITKTPPTDIKAGLSIQSATPQTVSSGQNQTNKQVSVPLLSTTQTSQHLLSTNSNPIKSMSKPEASPFTIQVNKLMSQSVPLVPTGKSTNLVSVTFPSSTLKSDSAPFTGIVKNDVQTVQISSESISFKPNTSITMPVSTPSLQSSFSFSSSAVAQKSSLTTENKPATTIPPPPTTTTTTTTSSSALDTFSFAPKPSNNTPFSFALKPSLPTSNVSQSLDLSMLSAGLQGSTNTINTATQIPTTTSSSFFGSTATSAPGSMFSGNPEIQKDKPQNTVSNNADVSSIFGGSMAGSSKPLPSFSEVTQSPTEKQKIFGAATSSAASIFNDSVAGTQTTIFGGVSTSLPSSSIFSSASQSTSASIFGGNTSPTATSPFGGTTTPLSNASSLMGTSTPIISPFGGTSNQAKSPVFPTDPVAPVMTSVFSDVVKPSLFGGAASAGAPPLSLFGGSSSSSANTSVFGGTTSNITPGASIFGGASPRPTAASIFGGSSSATPSSLFGAAATVSPSESMFGAPQIGTPTMSATSASPITSPGFGQAPTFGTKPEFGALGFGASKPVFGGGFGSSSFPSSMPTGGFGGFGTLPTLGVTGPAMGDNNSMQKVFGQATGSSTFEALAGQGGGLTFGNLAQKQPETEGLPAFSGGSSFQSWRCT